jgi:hypothetical protein
MLINLFALERYDTGLDEAPPFPRVPLSGASRLIFLVRLPDEDLALALVESSDSGSAAGSMAAAGWRVDRISPATWLCPPQPSSPAAYGSAPANDLP